MITRAPGQTTANGVVTFTGATQPGGTVLIGQVGANATQAIGSATADANGVWAFSTPANALGYGDVTLAAAALSADWTPGAWQDASVFSFADPETGLRHVGGDMAARLANDAANGLDATADLQAVADEVLGGDGSAAILDIPAGHYIISTTLFLHSGSYLDAPGVTLEGSDNFVLASGDNVIGRTLIANANYASDAYTDHDIQVRNIAFEWNGMASPGSTAIRFRSASNVMVANASFHGAEDGTAFMHDDGAVVRNSTASATLNYAYDNWEGPLNTVIANNTAEVGAFSGIAFTGRGRSDTDNFVGSNLAAYGNHITGAEAAGIQVEALSALSSVDNVFLAGNTIDGTGAGISVNGPGTGDVIFANMLSGSMGAAELAVEYQIRNVVIARNLISNATIRPGDTASLVVQASQAGIYGNQVIFGSAPWDEWIAGDGVISSGNAFYNWTNAALTTLGAGSVVISDPAGSQLPPAAAQLGYVLSNGTLVVTGAGVLDLRGVNLPGPVDTVQMQGGVGQILYLGGGAGVHVIGTPGGQMTVYGADTSDTIDLGDGGNSVVLGGAAETVQGGGGDDIFYIDAITAAAAIDGGGGNDQLMISGAGTVALGASIIGLESVRLLWGWSSTTLSLNATPGLTVRASNSGDTLIAGGPDQALISGAGSDIFVALPGGRTTIAGRGADLQGDTIEAFGYGDAVDVITISKANGRFLVTSDTIQGVSTLSVRSTVEISNIVLDGVFDPVRFHLEADSLNGVRAVYAAGTYTAGTGDEFGHVVDLLAGTDAMAGATYTLFIGGGLNIGSTLSLTADIAPVTLAGGARLDIDGLSHGLDAGTFQGLAVAAGYVALHDIALAGTPVTIGVGATLELGADVLGGVVAFSGHGGVLAIDHGVAWGGVVQGLVTGVAFDAVGIGVGSATLDVAAQSLTIIGNAGTVILALQAASLPGALQSAPVSGHVNVEADAAGTGTLVTFVACFCSGTRIATPLGAMQVEQLRIGDLVALADGGTQPIKWIGRRSYGAPTVISNPHLRPVRIRADAISPGVPRRDLLVSPQHAVAIGKVLCVAGGLINNISILRDPVGALAYFHIELDNHALVLAEGCPAETFLDAASRAMFDNSAEYAALYPAANTTQMALCLPRLEEGEALDAIRQRLATRAGAARIPAVPGTLRGNVERIAGGMIEGWAQDEADPSRPVLLELHAARMTRASDGAILPWAAG